MTNPISGRPNFVLEGVRCGVTNRHQRFTNFSSEGVRLGLSQKKPPKDSTLTYSLGRFTFRDVPQIATYHTKLLEDAELLTNLNEGLNATVELLSSVAC